MKAWPVMPGVPAAGHVTAGGYWHPGNAQGCVKCEPPLVHAADHEGTRLCGAHSGLKTVYAASVVTCPRCRVLAKLDQHNEGTQ